jgi:hypothetical protein
VSYRFLVIAPFLLAVSCQVKPYAPPPKAAMVESAEVSIQSFQGRPDAFVLVKGRLSSSVAQLVDPVQTREDGKILIEVLEQTPRGATSLTDLGTMPSYETRIPVELLGMDAGPCVLNVNGIEVTFEIPGPRATLVSHDPAEMIHATTVSLVDQFVPIEDTLPAEVIQ